VRLADVAPKGDSALTAGKPAAHAETHE
jgi:hypothetical protein